MSHSTTTSKSRRKPLEEGCDGGIWCPVEGHVVSSRKGTSWTYGHIKLSAGQEKTLQERRWAKHQERIDWIESRHGVFDHTQGNQKYPDGTHWKFAEAEWQTHLKEKSSE